MTPSSNRHPIGDETTTSSPPLSSEDEETHAALIGSRKSTGNFRKCPQPFASDSDADDEQETTQQSSSSQSSELKPKRPKVIKTEDVATPLPDPFLLPKYYRSDVEIALKNGKMTKETTSSFLSAVASAMLVYKRYTTKEDYICVARTILQKYPFMSSPVGAPYVRLFHIQTTSMLHTCLDGNLTFPHSYAILTHLYLGSHRDIVKESIQGVSQGTKQMGSQRKSNAKEVTQEEDARDNLLSFASCPSPRRRLCFLRET